MSELPPIEAWVAHVCAELGVDRDAVDLRALLDMTRDVAHGVDRPAAPVTAFVVGMAAARAGSDAESVRAACARVSDLADRWEAP